MYLRNDAFALNTPVRGNLQVFGAISFSAAEQAAEKSEEGSDSTGLHQGFLKLKVIALPTHALFFPTAKNPWCLFFEYLHTGMCAERGTGFVLMTHTHTHPEQWRVRDLSVSNIFQLRLDLEICPPTICRLVLLIVVKQTPGANAQSAYK